jgi:hypothetical protein
MTGNLLLVFNPSEQNPDDAEDLFAKAAYADGAFPM